MLRRWWVVRWVRWVDSWIMKEWNSLVAVVGGNMGIGSVGVSVSGNVDISPCSCDAEVSRCGIKLVN